jgi:hypothetical protein
MLALRRQKREAIALGRIQPGIGWRLQELRLVHPLRPGCRLRVETKNETRDLIMNKGREALERLNRLGRTIELFDPIASCLPRPACQLELAKLTAHAGEPSLPQGRY